MLRICALLMAGLFAWRALASIPIDCPGARRPCLVAHRGWSHPTQVENSLREMRRTWNAHRPIIELDLSTNKDGTIYLLHDERIDRTTNGRGQLALMSDREVAALRLKDGHGRLTGETLPRFDSVLAWAKATNGVILMLDLKQADAARVAAMVRGEGLTGRVIVLTFDAIAANAAFAADPNWLVSVLIKGTGDLDEYRTRADGRKIAAYLPTFAAPKLFGAVRAAGFAIISDAITSAPGGGLDKRASRGGISVYRRYLAERPVDILVTDHVDRIPQAPTTAR